MRGSGEGVVTQAALIDHLAIYLKPKKERTNMRYLPVLYPFFKASDMVGLSRLLVMYFVGISLAWPEQWKSAEAIGASLFGKTNGVAVMFSVLHDLIIDSGGTTLLAIDQVRAMWSKVPSGLITVPPRGGSKGFQAELTAKVLEAILGNKYDAALRKKIEEFKPRLRDVGALVD